jgi:3-dehydroquinate dehydratase-1
MVRLSSKRARVVGVIASYADFERALGMRAPPDLFELRLDRLASMTDRVARSIRNIRTPFIITARHPLEGGAGELKLHERRHLLGQFLDHADYIDVELRSATALRSLLDLARSKKVHRIISFHNFERTPEAQALASKARQAKSHGADIFKVATRTDTPIELGRLLEFMRDNRAGVAFAAMGIGKLGTISRVLLARAGSSLIYVSLGAQSDIEGQLSLEQVRTLGLDA